MSVLPPWLPAQSASLEYPVKAAYLLNFARFVQWPAAAFESAASPVRICVLGRDPFGESLPEVLAGELVGGRKIEHAHISSAAAARGCHIVFTASSDRNDVRAVIEALRTHPVLTVGETADFLEAGGTIRFLLEQRRVRFDINLAAGERAGLKISSRLLQVARSVRR